MKQTITCHTLSGLKVVVRKKDLIVRPSVYAVVVWNGKMLLATLSTSDKFWIPGGGVEAGETLEEALKREVREECGVRVKVVKPLFFMEDFFFCEAPPEPWHGIMLFYQCQPLSFKTHSRFNVAGDEMEHPKWHKISDLKPSDFHIFGKEILAAAHQN